MNPEPGFRAGPGLRAVAVEFDYPWIDELQLPWLLVCLFGNLGMAQKPTRLHLDLREVT